MYFASKLLTKITERIIMGTIKDDLAEIKSDIAEIKTIVSTLTSASSESTQEPATNAATLNSILTAIQDLTVKIDTETAVTPAVSTQAGTTGTSETAQPASEEAAHS